MMDILQLIKFSSFLRVLKYKETKQFELYCIKGEFVWNLVFPAPSHSIPTTWAQSLRSASWASSTPSLHTGYQDVILQYEKQEFLK